MKAIILAAGTGTRLRPLTDDIPKCLVKLKGKPLLDYQLETLHKCGIVKIVLVTGYKHDALDSQELTCCFNPEFSTSNMVHSLFCAESEFDDDLIISYGDIIYEPKILQALLASSAEVSVVVDSGWQQLWQLRMSDPLSDAESLRIDSKGNILDIGHKVSTVDEIEGQYIGLLKISSQCLPKFAAFFHSLDKQANYDGKDFQNMFMTSFIQRLIDASWTVKSVPVTHGWLEIDTLTDLECYEKLPNASALFNFGLFDATNTSITINPKRRTSN